MSIFWTYIFLRDPYIDTPFNIIIIGRNCKIWSKNVLMFIVVVEKLKSQSLKVINQNKKNDKGSWIS